jgi:hypothetical protein
VEVRQWAARGRKTESGRYGDREEEEEEEVTTPNEVTHSNTTFAQACMQAEMSVIAPLKTEKKKSSTRKFHKDTLTQQVVYKWINYRTRKKHKLIHFPLLSV